MQHRASPHAVVAGAVVVAQGVPDCNLLASLERCSCLAGWGATWPLRARLHFVKLVDPSFPHFILGMS